MASASASASAFASRGERVRGVAAQAGQQSSNDFVSKFASAPVLYMPRPLDRSLLSCSPSLSPGILLAGPGARRRTPWRSGYMEPCQLAPGSPVPGSPVPSEYLQATVHVSVSIVAPSAPEWPAQARSSSLARCAQGSSLPTSQCQHSPSQPGSGARLQQPFGTFRFLSGFCPLFVCFFSSPDPVSPCFRVQTFSSIHHLQNVPCRLGMPRI